MDPLSAFASAIAVIQLADRMVELCKAYITGVKDAPADLRAILIEVGSLKCVLEVIELLDASKGGSSNVTILAKLDSPLQGCREALESLEAMFPAPSEAPSSGKRQRIELPLARLAWPFKREKALKLLEELGRHKGTISLGLTTEAAQDLKDIRKSVDQIRSTTDNIELSRTLEWLVTTDPSSNHNNACELHEPHTGKWLTNSPEYASWKDCITRFLWLHGIPGAGKTVLHSFIVEDVKKFCNNPSLSTTGWAYYYCYFGRNQDETPHFLRWVISQLCRQIKGLPPDVQQLFREGGHPSISRLLEVLGSVSQLFSRIYIVIDALDESKDRERLSQALIKILEAERLASIQLLVTSRKELDIERAILPLSTTLSLSNPYVDDDIRTYIKSCLSQNRRFSKWPDKLKEEIEKALVKGAKGMFRWAFCQLDILSRLTTAKEIRIALTQLPRTLDETYERILCSIPLESQRICHTTLQLLCTGYIYNLHELKDALAVDVENASFDRCNGPVDLYAPVEACTCLVTYNSDTEEVILAHYTVKEYLVSSRIRDGPAQKYQMTEESMYYLAAQCFMIYIMQEDYTLEKHQLLECATFNWYEAAAYVRSAVLQKVVDSLVFDLLDPTRPHFHEWLRRQPWKPVWSVEAGTESCITLAHLLWDGIENMAQRFFDSRMDQASLRNYLTWNNWRECVPYNILDIYGSGMEKYQPEKQSFGRKYAIETPRDPRDSMAIAEAPEISQESANFSTGYQSFTLLHLAALTLNEFLLQFLISKGADVNSQTPLGISVLSTALYSTIKAVTSLEMKLAVVKLLLSNDANPAVAKTSITPIQMTIMGLMDINSITIKMNKARSIVLLDLLQVLIDAGADINGVADDETNIARIRYGCSLYFPTNTHDVTIEEDIVATLLENRGRHLCYSTPLRILEVLVASKDWDDLDDDLARYNALGDFLKSRSAKSLHLFPVKGLPGYIEEDMEEWGKITDNGAKIELKQSNVDPEDNDNEDERSTVDLEEDGNDIEVHNSMC